MNSRALALLVLCASLTGCMRSLKVQHSVPLAAPPKAQSLPGLPFYSKIGICKQESVWMVPQYLLRYEAASGAVSEKLLDAAAFEDTRVQQFIAKPGDPRHWDVIMTDFKPPEFVNEGMEESTVRSAINGQEALRNWFLISNTASIESIVDYSNVFYLNSARPLAGSTQVSGKLASDGTLTEASAQLEDKTVETIASAISSLVSSATSAATLTDKKDGTLLTAKLTVTPKIYLHVHTQYTEAKTMLTCVKHTPAVYGGSFSVSEKTEAKADKKDDNSISVSGTVTLPKAAAKP